MWYIFSTIVDGAVFIGIICLLMIFFSWSFLYSGDILTWCKSASIYVGLFMAVTAVLFGFGILSQYTLSYIS